MENNQDFNAHNFKRFKMERDFFSNLEREMRTDFARSFNDEEDITYENINFSFTDDELEQVYQETFEQLYRPMGKLRKRIVEGPKKNRLHKNY